MMVKGKFYITTAIYYPNANPHIGHAYEHIVTDVYARWNRLKGKKTFFLTGLDEHGQKLQTAAENENMLPQDFVDDKAVVFREFFKKVNSSHDGFIRTSDKRHLKTAKEIFQKVLDKGDIYQGEYVGHYCVPCETYWTDKQLVEGNCPNCKRPTTLLREPSYFFKMSKYQKQLLDYMEKNPKFIVPGTRKNEVMSRLKEPLRDLSVSRASFDWGIKLPNDETHVLYVWFDALINYLSGLDYPGKKFEQFWPADVHVIGKDIIWFHTVIWPCMLFAVGMEPPKQVYVHGFINDSHGEKMSKSKGNVVDPTKIIDKYGLDAVRYYFLRGVVSGNDGNFSERDLVQRYNGELANDLGNLVMRIVKLVMKGFDGRLSCDGCKQEIDFQKIMTEADRSLDSFEHHRALDKIWSLLNETNAYINKKEPWKIKDKKELGAVLYNVLESLRASAIMLHAFIPKTCEKIAEQIGFEIIGLDNLEFGKQDYSLKEGKALFPKIEELPEEKQTFPIDLRVAKILSVDDHPDAEKLYVLKIDLGKEKRQLVAGLKSYYKPEEMKDKKIIVVANMKPAKLRGVESQGMLLAADYEKDGKEIVGLLGVTDSELGASVYPEGYEVVPAKSIDFKQFQKYSMITDEKSNVLFKNKHLKTDKELVKAERVKAGAKVR